MSKCGFIKASGEACKAIPMSGEGWCYAHQPEYRDKRRRDGAKGGKRGGRGRPLGDVARIQAKLEELAELVLAEQLDRADAAVAGQLLNYAVAAIRTGLQVREHEELTQRLEALEESLQHKGGARWGA